jgi:hypothetical protein
MEEMRAEGTALKERIENARQQGDAAAKSLDTQRKCRIIAMRIINGDIVPDADHRFLMENDPEMYKRAIMLRRHKQDPDEYDRLSDDEEKSSKISVAAGDSGGVNIKDAGSAEPNSGETVTVDETA